MKPCKCSRRAAVVFEVKPRKAGAQVRPAFFVLEDSDEERAGGSDFSFRVDSLFRVCPAHASSSDRLAR
jgi:hypothetical protein